MPAFSPRWVIDGIPVAALADGHFHQVVGRSRRRKRRHGDRRSGKSNHMFHASSPRCFDSQVRFMSVEAAEAANQRVGADRQHEQHDQHGIHARHVEDAVGLDDQKADALVRQLGLGQQRADQRDAEPEPDAVDDRMAHRRQVDLCNHLPGRGAEALADADQHLVDLAHAGRDRKRHGEEAGQGAERNLGAGADAEPHDHDRKEDDLWRWAEIVEVGLERLRQETVGAEQDADREPDMPADQQAPLRFHLR